MIARLSPGWSTQAALLGKTLTMPLFPQVYINETRILLGGQPEKNYWEGTCDGLVFHSRKGGGGGSRNIRSIGHQPERKVN